MGKQGSVVLSVETVKIFRNLLKKQEQRLLALVLK